MIDKILKESETSKEKYGHFNSTHEVYGVLIEEVEEFLELVKSKEPGRSEKMQHELVQIAAVAIRAAGELKNDEIKWI